MATEIERKFLVDADAWQPPSDGGSRFVQGYLSVDPARTVRVRTEGDRGVLTIKGRTVGITRSEFEYEIPLTDARDLLKLSLHPPLTKTRHVIDENGSRWEVDVFDGVNAGLVLAEIELVAEDAPFHRPPWLGVEVTHESRYGNSSLAQRPFSTWPDDI